MPREPGTAGDAVETPLPTGTVTFLFTDVEGSTRLLQQNGEEAYGGLLNDHRQLLRASFTAHDGREVDTQGDSFFIAFPRAPQALAAAVDAQRALARHRWPVGSAVRVRMGLHSGGAIEVDGSYVSVAVHRAARIAAAAHGGQVLLSDATASLAREELPKGVTLRDLGEHRLKDFPVPARLFQLVSPDLPADLPPPRTLVPRWRLPSPPGSFVGRSEDVASLVALLRNQRTRLVTLTGTGGIGKTRLATEVARAVAADFPGGAAFVPLAAVIDPALVLGVVADALGARREPGADLNEDIVAVLGEDRTLLVLDNLEQVAGAAGDLADLVERVPTVVLLVTSRTLLRLRAEQQFAVRPLDETAAVRLFEQRANAARPGSVEDDQAVLGIARRLDGLPLAIELAAARARLLSPGALLERLRDSQDVLGAGPVDLPQRQRTLRSTMDWSYGLLTPHEKALFARLGVFGGGWPLDAVDPICGRPDEPDVLDALGALVDASLVVRDGPGPEPRFSMLETVREYARERLAASVEREETERRHARWVLGLAGDLLHARGREYGVALERLDRERGNLRAAALRLLESGDLDAFARLIRDAISFVALRDAEVEVVGWLDRALARAENAAPAVRGRLLVLRSVMSFAADDPTMAAPLLAEGEPLLPNDADHEIDHAVAATAAIQLQADLEGAMRTVEVALARYTALGIQLGQAGMHLARGDMLLALGDPARAMDDFRCSADLAGGLGDDAMLGPALTLLGLSQAALGDVAAARRSMLDGALVNGRVGLPTNLLYSVVGLAAVALAEDRPSMAVRILAAAATALGDTARPLTPALPPLIERMISQSRGELAEEGFEQASAEGRRWSLHDALDHALEDVATSPGDGTAADYVGR